RPEVEGAAGPVVAALGIAATTLAYEEGFALRSRCVLVPKSSLTFDLVGRAGSAETVELDTDSALALLAEAAERAVAAGLGWRAEELLLRPSDRLVELIRRRQDIAAAGEGEDCC